MQYILTEDEYKKLTTHEVRNYESREAVSSLRHDILQFINGANIVIQQNQQFGNTTLRLEISEGAIPKDLLNLIKNAKGIS